MSGYIPVITTTLGVEPELAPKVISGLKSGAYERVGGVVRRVDNKQIVAWLRNVADWDTINVESLARLGPLMQLNAAVSLLDLSVSAVGFAMVMHRLGVIERKLDAIAQVLQEVNRKLDLSFYANFRAALELARSAFAMQNEANRRTSATQAVNRFLEAEHHYLGLLDMELEVGSLAVSPFFSTLVLAFVSVARCYLELEEIETARSHLQESSSALKLRVQMIYETVVGVKPAIYLHPSLSDSISLERMTNLLRHQDPTLNEAAVFESLRGSLWETASQDLEPWLRSLPQSIWSHEVDGEKKTGPIKRPRSREEIFERLLPRLPGALTEVEQAVEAVGCIDGYEVELDYLIENGISFRDWRLLEVPATTEDDLIVWVIPQESELLLER